MKPKKHFFSILEMSVVIALVSILISMVLVSRKIVSSAIGSGIYHEAKTYISVFDSFKNIYGFAPGVASDAFLFSFGNPVNSNIYKACSRSLANGANFPNTNKYRDTDIVNTPTASMCAMLELKMAGFLKTSQIDNDKINLAGYKSVTCSGLNVPSSEKIKSLSWYIRHNKDANEDPFLPYEFFMARDNIAKHAVILGGSGCMGGVHNTAVNGVLNNISAPISQGSNPAGVSVGIASYIDSKFDDGRPHDGNIISGNHGHHSGGFYDKGSKSSCIIIPGGIGAGFGWSDFSASNQYNNGKQLCTMAFLIER